MKEIIISCLRVFFDITDGLANVPHIGSWLFTAEILLLLYVAWLAVKCLFHLILFLADFIVETGIYILYLDYTQVILTKVFNKKSSRCKCGALLIDHYTNPRVLYERSLENPIFYPCNNTDNIDGFLILYKNHFFKQEAEEKKSGLISLVCKTITNKSMPLLRADKNVFQAALNTVRRIVDGIDKLKVNDKDLIDYTNPNFPKSSLGKERRDSKLD